MITNREYMNLYKSVVKNVLFLSVGLVILVVAIEYWCTREKIKNYIHKAFSFLMLGLLALAVLSCYAHLYSYMYSCSLFGIVLLGALKILLAESENHEICESENEKNINVYIVVGIGCLFVVLVLFSQMLNATGGFFQKFNAAQHMGVTDYLLVVLLYIVLFFSINFIFPKQKKLKNLFSRKETLFSLLLIELTLLVELGDWEYSLTIPKGFLLLIVIVALFLVYLQRDVFTENVSRYICFTIEALIGIGVILNNVQINYWGNGWSDVYHTNWYYTQLYRIGFHEPYIGGYEEIYGHFGLFYKIPMDLFGHNLLVIGCTTAVFTLIMYGSLVGIINQVTKSMFSRILAAIALFVTFTKNFAYPMNVPHRILFPSILLFYVIKNLEKNFSIIKVLTGYIICFFSIIWSTETGMMCSVVYTLYIALRIVYKKEKGLISCIGYFATLIPAVLLLFLGSYGVVQGYNIMHGAKWSEYSLSQYLGILLDKDFMNSAQMNVFYFENANWLYFMILFIAMASFGAVKCGLLNRKERDIKGILWLIISTMGLCYMVIIISRPNEDDTVVIPYVIMLLLLSLEHIQKWAISRLGNRLCRKNVSPLNIAKYMILIAAIIFFANIVVRFPGAIKQITLNINEYHRWDYQVVKRCEEPVRKLPLDQVYPVGVGIRLLFLDMGISVDNGLGGLAPEGSGTVEEELKATDKPYILTDLDLPEDQYTKTDELYIDQFVYTLYLKGNTE